MITGTAKRYYYDDQRIALQTSVSSGGTETDEKYFVFGNYIDEVLLMHNLAGTYTGDFYYGHDHLYSPVALFESDGDLVERYEYDVYGACRILTSGFSLLASSQYGNPYAFTGRELDSFDNNALKLMYYRARYYHTQTGRFLQRDPLEYVEGMSLYEYVISNPLVIEDPSGLCTLGFKDTIDKTWRFRDKIGTPLYIPISGPLGISLTKEAMIDAGFYWQKECVCCKNGGTAWQHKIKVKGQFGVRVKGTAGIVPPKPLDFGYAKISYYAGIEIVGSSTGNIDAGGVFSECLGQDAYFEFCVNAKVQATISVGGRAEIQVGNWRIWRVGLEGIGSGSVDTGICFKCTTGGCSISKTEFGNFHASVSARACFGACYTWTIWEK